MNKIFEDKKKIVYKDRKGNGEFSLFTMLDMGSYVGHQYRDVFDTEKSEWRLMFKDDFDKDNNKLRHTEALVDSLGYYSRIIENDIQNNTKRVILCEGDRMEEDYIIDYNTGETNKLYEFDRTDRRQPTICLNDYLARNETIENERIIEYLNNNSLLKREIHSGRGL